jgi:multidrug resistance efflux pump
VARLEPARQEALLAPEDLTLASTRFSAGQRVAAGEPLAVLDADSMRTGAGEAVARAGAWRMEGARARLVGSPVEAADALTQAASEEQALALVNRRVERAVLRAPFAGRVMSPSLRGLEGRMVEAGDTVCVVGDFSRVRASVVVTDSDLEDVVTGSPVRLRMRADPGQALRGHIEAIEPLPVALDQPRRYRVWMALDQAPPDARAGLTAQAWVRTPPRTPASHLKQAVLRFVRLDLWV